MSNLSKNIIYNLLGQALLLALSFVAVRRVFGHLGEDALGLIYFTLSVNTVLTALLEVGISSTVVREIAGHSHDEPAYIEDLIGTASFFCWTACLILAAVVYLGAPLVADKWIALKTLDAASATRVLRVLGVAALVALPQRLYASMFRGLQRMEVNNLIDVATTAIQQLGMILILAAGGRLFQLIYWLALSFGISIATYILVSARFFSWRALLPRYVPMTVARNFKYSSNVTLISVLAAVQTQSDKLVLSRLVPVGLLGFYSVAYNIVARASLLSHAISQAVFPVFSVLSAGENRSSLMVRYHKIQDLVCLATVPVFAAIPFAAVPLFTYVFDRSIANMLLLPVTFLSLGFYMNGTLIVPYFFSLAVGKPEISVRLNLLALFVVLPMTVALIRLFGLAGAGFSWVFYHLLAYAYAVPKICSQCLAITAAEWFAHVGRILVAASLSYGLGWTIANPLGTSSVAALLLAYVGGSGAYALIGYRLMGNELRVTLLGLWKTLRGSAVKIA